MPSDTLTDDTLDQATIDLIFALRDSLTDVSRLDFWNGRCTSAIETAAAGATTMPQAITIAAQKLQIDTLTREASTTVVHVTETLGGHYEAWASHVARNIVYLVALARVENDSRKTAKKTAASDPAEADAAPMF